MDQSGGAKVYAIIAAMTVSKLLIVGAFIIAVLLGGVYLFNKQFNNNSASSVTTNQKRTIITPTVTPSVSAESAEPLPSVALEETVDWKTYDKKNFVLKYPNTWSIQEESEYLNTVEFTNNNKTVTLLISEGQYPYGFESPDTKTESKSISLIVGGKNYQTNETTINNKSVFVNLKLNNSFNHHVLFGTGYPASGKDSLTDYNQEKNTIVKMLSTFKLK